MWELADLLDSADYGGLESLMGGGDYVGDLPVDLGTDYVGDLPLDTDFYTGPSDLMEGYQGTVGDFPAGAGADGGMGGANNGAGGGSGLGLPKGLGELFKSAMAELSKPGAGGGGSLSMPRVASQVADRVGAVPVPSVQTGAVPSTPPGDATFRPMTGAGAPAAQSPDLSGLARLFARQPGDPYAEARAMTAPRGGA